MFRFELKILQNNNWYNDEMCKIAVITTWSTCLLNKILIMLEHYLHPLTQTPQDLSGHMSFMAFGV